MKIAFPTDDRVTIAERTGRCNEFAILEIEESQIKNIEYISNPHIHSEEESEEENHNHSDIMEALKDVDILYVMRIGRNMKNDMAESGLKYQITKENVIQNLLTGITGNKSGSI